MGEKTDVMQVIPFVLRPMTIGDIDAVTEIERRSFTTPWLPETFAAEIEDNDLACYMVAETGGEVVGYAGMWLILDEAHITNVAVLPQFRGAGAGRLLMDSLIALAEENGAVGMTLEVRVSNAAARSLYEKTGFEVRGVRRGYYSDTKEDALIMWRDTPEKKNGHSRGLSG